MARNSRLTADITLEAHNLLRGLVKKHERSKGYLLEKMIRTYCNTGKEDATAKSVEATEKPRKIFVPPALEEVAVYMLEKCGDTSEAEKFCDFYESKGWVVGRAKMKCWKASVRNWLKGSAKAEGKAKQVDSALDDTSWANNLDDVL